MATTRYEVRQYAADGGALEIETADRLFDSTLRAAGVEAPNGDERHIAWAETPDEAREIIARLVAPATLDDCRWSPDEDEDGVQAMEAYSAVGPEHDRAYGCGGFEIVAVEE